MEHAHEVITLIRNAVEYEEDPPKEPNIVYISKILWSLFRQESFYADITELLIGHAFNAMLATAKDAIQHTDAHGGNAKDNIAKSLPDSFTPRARQKLAEHLYEAARKSLRPRKRIGRSGAPVSLGYCYLCGEQMYPSDDTVTDHVVPRRVGGSDQKSNLAEAHGKCEAYKFAYFQCSDAPVFSFTETQMPAALAAAPPEAPWPRTIENKNQFSAYASTIAHAQIRIAVMQRQKHKCTFCSEAFSPTRLPIIAKREISSPWTYSNSYFVCQPCNKQGQHDTQKI